MKFILRRVAIAVCSAATLFASLSHGTVGQPGTLDPLWATGSPLGPGKVITPIGTGSGSASAVAVQPDGKVVLAGGCFPGPTPVYSFCALRYHANGTLDTSFGSGGTVITQVGTAGSADSVALQSDGKLVLAGGCSNGTNLDFCALRYHANGTLDTSFGNGGAIITPIFTASSRVRAVALQPDGKLVLAGYCGSGSYVFCAVRYNGNGTIDESFGSGGLVIAQIGASDDRASAVALQPDGKLVLSGFCSNGINRDFCAVRYLANGTLNTSFGSGGKVITSVGVITPVGPSNFIGSVALQPDGKLVLAGACSGSVNIDFCALRYNANGTLNTSFGIGGAVITEVGTSNDFAFAVALQPDGKLVLAGRCVNTANDDFCALRYHANGTLDASFDSNGRVITPVSTSYDSAAAVALQPDGKVVLAGNCSNGANTAFCAIRYDGGPFGFQNCKLDIDGDGRVLPTTDSLIHARIALGITGPAAVNGATSPTATRNTWPLVRDYLVTQCGMSLPP